MLRVPVLTGGLTSFFFQYFLQAGMFFAVPLFLSVALGLSAIDTGIRLLPLSITLLLAAAGIPKAFPNASPRHMTAALDDAGVDPTTSDAIIDENAEARLNGLRASLSVLAIIALVALVFTRRIPTTQPGAVAVGAVQ